MGGNLTLHVESKGELRARLEEEGFGGSYHRLLVANPLSASDDDPVGVVARTGDTEVGRISTIVGRFHAEGRPVPMLWGAGLNVPEEHRKTGAGLMLVLRLQQLAPTLGVVGVSRQALELYQRLRWTDIRMPRYLLLRTSRPVLQKFLRPAWLARAARPVADSLLRGQHLLVRARSWLIKRGLRIEATAAMDTALDARLAQCDLPATCHRSAAWFEWLLSFQRRGEGISRQLYLVKDGQDEVVGYFLNTTRLHGRASVEGFENLLLGSVKDWQSFDRGRLSDADLLLLASCELLKGGLADAIEVCTTDRRAGSALSRLGFVRRGALHFMIKTGPGSPLADGRFHRGSNWRIRPADGDHFYF